MTMKSTFLFNFLLRVVVATCILVFPASDIFAIDSTSVRVVLPDTSADPSISIDIPVTVTEMTGGPGVFSADIEITYDASALQATAVKKGDLTATSPFSNLSDPGIVRFAIADFQEPFSGTGTLAVISFNVVGSPGQTSSLTFQKAVFDESPGLSSSDNGSFRVLGAPLAVKALSVPDTSARSGDLIVVPVGIYGITLADSIISVQLELVFKGSVLKPASVLPGSLPDATWQIVGNITNSDTVKVALAGSTPLVGNTTLAFIGFRVVGADGDSTDIVFEPGALANEKNFVTDLGGILDNGSLFVQGVAPPIAIRADTIKAVKGSWVEIPVFVDRIFREDGFVSAEFDLFYDPTVIEPGSAMSFRGNVVDTSWQFVVNVTIPGKVSVAMAGAQPPLLGSGVLAVIHAKVIGNVGNFTVLNLENGLLNETPVEAIDGLFAVVPPGILRTGFLEASPGEWAKVPVFVDSLFPGAQVISAQFRVHYDPAVLRADTSMFSTGSVVDNLWRIVANEISPGSLNVALAGPTPISGNGVLVDLHFEVVGAPGDSTVLDLENGLLNEDSVETVDGLVKVVAPVVLVIPDNIEINEGEMELVPVILEGNPGGFIFSAEMGITYNPAVIRADSATLAGTIVTDSPSLAFNVENGVINIGLASANPINGNGPLVFIKFTAVGSEGDSTIVDIFGPRSGPNPELNEGIIPAVRRGKIRITAPSVPSLALSDTVLGFGSVRIDTFSQRILYIINERGTDLIIDSLFIASTGEFQIIEPATPIGIRTIPAGDSLRVTIEFEPGFTGVREDTLHILSNDPDSPDSTVALVGVGLRPPRPIIALLPAPLDTLDFGAVKRLRFNQRIFFISNVGGTILNVDSLFTVTSDFRLVEPSPGLKVVPPDDSLKVRVRFSPTAEAGRIDALTIKSNDPVHPDTTVVLIGFGLPPPEPEIALSDTLLDFNSPPVNVAVRRMLTIRSVGDPDTVLIIDSLRVNNNDYTILDPPDPTRGDTLSVGDSLKVTIEFGRSAVGLSDGILTIFSNDPLHPDTTVLLKGETQPPGVISDITVCNLTATGATITWLTDRPATVTDSVRVLNPSISLDVVFTASRIGFNTHLVGISGLTAATEGYSFEVRSEGATSSGTFDTLPEGTPGLPQNATVKVLNEDSTDAVGALVSATVTDPLTSLVSLPICGLTGPTGVATLPLDLVVGRHPVLGLIKMTFSTGAGTFLSTVLGAKDGRGNSASSAPLASSDMNLNVNIDTLQLSAAIEVVIPLPRGFSLISPPVVPESTITSHTLLPLIANAREIDRWNNAASLFESAIRASDGTVITDPAEAFDVTDPEGIFVKVTAASDVTFRGSPIRVPLTLTLGKGFNIVGVPFPLGFTSHTLLPLIPNAREIDRWNNAASLFESAIRTSDGTVITDPAQAFSIELGEGYFVKVLALTEFTPPVSAPKAITPEPYELNYRKFEEEVSPNVFPFEVRVSNVTDLAATVSWISSENHLAQVQYGTDPDFSYYDIAYDVRGVEYPDDLHLVEIIGLSPNTNYYYRILPLDSNGKGENKARTFETTPPLTSIPYPYVIYGRMVEEGGNQIEDRGLVYAKVVHEGKESDRISATASASGYWSLNLGNLRDRVTGDPFQYLSGDDVVLEYYGSSGRYGIHKGEVGTDTPQDISELILTETITMKLPDLDENDSGDVPQAYTLFQNFPNPFNPETEISYDMPEDNHVWLRIYNLLGQPVRTLVDEHQKASHYVVRWDGMDDNGTDLASGIYFYRILTDNFVSSKRMLLMR